MVSRVLKALTSLIEQQKCARRQSGAVGEKCMNNILGSSLQHTGRRLEQAFGTERGLILLAGQMRG